LTGQVHGQPRPRTQTYNIIDRGKADEGSSHADRYLKTFSEAVAASATIFSPTIASPAYFIAEMFAELDRMNKELGYFELRPWCRDNPQRLKVWAQDPTASNVWASCPATKFITRQHRHPEVAAKRPSKDSALRLSSFETRLVR
jgi:hypothetical protein